MTSVRIEGLEQALAKIDLIANGAAVRRGLAKAAIVVMGVLKQYPGPSEANRPGRIDSQGRRLGYYKRGTGYFSARGQLMKPSEQLKEKWAVESRQGGYQQIVGNNVSYGPYVQDAGYQPLYHKARGWRTIQQVAEAEAVPVAEIIAAEVAADLRR